MFSRRFILFIFIIILFPQIIITGCKQRKIKKSALRSDDSPADSNPSLLEVWEKLKESSATGRPIPIEIDGQPITYGAEKEGSSALITRIAGPDSNTFKKLTEGISDEERTIFLRDFFKGYVTGQYREKNPIIDVNGKEYRIDLSKFASIDYDRLGLEELTTKLDEWLTDTYDHPFSFLNRAYRKKLYDGTAAGLTKSTGFFPYYNWEEHVWQPIFGPMQKYIDKVKGELNTNVDSTASIWEINFTPQKTYGEFEAMISWFRQELAQKVQGEDVLFDAPGHHRLVFPVTRDVQGENFVEILKNAQAYIVLGEIIGRTGYYGSRYYAVYTDEKLRKDSIDRAAIRIENDRFGEGTNSIEIRAGVKSDKTRRLVEHSIIAFATDYSQKQLQSNWQLIPSQLSYDRSDFLKETFRAYSTEMNIPLETVENVAAKFMKAETKSWRNVNFLSGVPVFWHWYNAPFVRPKLEYFKKITQDFFYTAEKLQNPSSEQLESLLRDWALATNLKADIEKYLLPKDFSLKENAFLYPDRPEAPVDVNTIDLGIEYTGRYPMRNVSDFDEETFDGKLQWLKTYIDLSMEERSKVLRDVAETLGRYLNPGAPLVEATALNNEGHGHGLSLAYEIKDQHGRTWRVEWDGIGRAYDASGNVVEGSARGGHIEIVTPKFIPTYDEISKIYDTLDTLGLTVNQKSGGGHINIDLEPFSGKPREFARFLNIFHRHRGIMALMFQSESRLTTAEALNVNPLLVQKLADFSGTETELKQLLYNEHYFNTRLNRKTRYSMLDVAAYFQDVIPAEFITQDFDLGNPQVVWRRMFKVDPQARKAEFRMFDAPRNAMEAGLQIKFVRALLNKALNENDPIEPILQKVDHGWYAENVNQAEVDFAALCAELKLNPEEYKVFLYDGILKAGQAHESELYQPFVERVHLYPKQEDGWMQALTTPRSPAEAISYKDREYEKNAPNQTVDESARRAAEKRQENAEKMEEKRQQAAAMSGSACERLTRHFDLWQLLIFLPVFGRTKRRF